MKIKNIITYYKFGKFILNNLDQIPEFKSKDIEKDKSKPDRFTSMIYVGDTHMIRYWDKNKEHAFFIIIDKEDEV